MTLTDESIRMATIVYRRHDAYLRTKIIIVSAQSAIWSKHRSRLISLEASNSKNQIRIANEKSVLRQQFKVSQIDQQTYQSELKRLTKEALEFSQPYESLMKKIEKGLEEIKQTMIDKLLAGVDAKNRVLQPYHSQSFHPAMICLRKISKRGSIFGKASFSRWSPSNRCRSHWCSLANLMLF